MKPFWNWKRNQKGPEQSPEPEHRRQNYRSKPGEGRAAHAALYLPSGEAVPAEIVDVSASGAALRLALEHDPVLSSGDVIELSVELPGRQPVKTPAEVIFSEQDGDRHVRYGFRYTNIGNLYSQLDEQYARLFNRRNTRRTAATLHKRIPIRLTSGGFLIDTQIHDLSEGGIGVLLSRAEAAQLHGAMRLQATFRTSPGGDELEGSVDVVHREGRNGKVLLGLRFVLEEPGFGAHAQAIQAFVSKRNDQLDEWEGSWRSAG